MIEPHSPKLIADLRAAGFDVGIREAIVLERVLLRAAACSEKVRMDAVASLLGRSREDYARIHQALARPPVEPPPPVVDEAGRRWWRWAPLAVVVVIIGVVLLWPPKPIVHPPIAEDAGQTGIIDAGPVPSPLPEPPNGQRVPSGTLLGLMSSIASALAGLVVLHDFRSHGRRRVREIETNALAEARGPRDYVTAAPHWPKQLVEDIATHLQRVRVVDSPADLDVNATLEATLRAGGFLVPKYASSRAPAPIVAIVHTGSAMEPHRAWVFTLLRSLAKAGVDISWQWLDGELPRVWSDARPRAEELGTLRAHAQGALWVFAPTPERGVTGMWQAALAEWPRRVWVAPRMALGARWESLGLASFPLSPRGVLASARALAELGGTERRSERLPASEDVMLLRGLLTLAPRASFEVAHGLRQHFLPAVSAELVAATAPIVAGDVLEWERASRYLSERDPGGSLRESATTWLVKEWLGFEPEPGSVAHARWKRDIAILLARLGNPTGPKALAEVARTLPAVVWERRPAIASLAQNESVPAGERGALQKVIDDYGSAAGQALRPRGDWKARLPRLGAKLALLFGSMAGATWAVTPVVLPIAASDAGIPDAPVLPFPDAPRVADAPPERPDARTPTVIVIDGRREFRGTLRADRLVFRGGTVVVPGGSSLLVEVGEITGSARFEGRGAPGRSGSRGIPCSECKRRGTTTMTFSDRVAFDRARKECAANSGLYNGGQGGPGGKGGDGAVIDIRVGDKYADIKCDVSGGRGGKGGPAGQGMLLVLEGETGYPRPGGPNDVPASAASPPQTIDCKGRDGPAGPDGRTGRCATAFGVRIGPTDN